MLTYLEVCGNGQYIHNGGKIINVITMNLSHSFHSTYARVKQFLKADKSKVWHKLRHRLLGSVLVLFGPMWICI